MKTNESYSPCPLYENCRTGRDLPADFCAQYRCNTFHGIDTIGLHVMAMKILAEANGNGHDSDINSLVRERTGLERHAEHDGYNGRRKPRQVNFK